MGELFKHFQGWDVQALRQEIKEAQDEAVKAKEEAISELMEEYELSREIAEEKAALYW